MKTKQTNETVEEDLSSRRYYTNANISLKFIGLKQKPTPEYINFLNGEIAEWIKEVREKDTQIKQLQDEIRMLKEEIRCPFNGIDIYNVEKIKEFPKHFNDKEMIYKVQHLKQFNKLKQQLTDVKKKIIKYHNGIPDGSSCEGCILMDKCNSADEPNCPAKMIIVPILKLINEVKNEN